MYIYCKLTSIQCLVFIYNFESNVRRGCLLKYAIRLNHMPLDSTQHYTQGLNNTFTKTAVGFQKVVATLVMHYERSVRGYKVERHQSTCNLHQYW